MNKLFFSAKLCLSIFVRVVDRVIAQAIVYLKFVKFV